MSAAHAKILIDEAIEAHGGSGYWDSLDALEISHSAEGFLFVTKHRRKLDHVRARLSTREPRLTFYDFPEHGQQAELLGEQEVRIRDRQGRILDRRLQPRLSFRSFRRQLFWDDLDFTYFAGYAMWNYLTMPFLFAREGFLFDMLEPVPGDFESCSRILVTFPPDLPTHCRKQIYYFDHERHLRRLDYTAEVIGGWARAAHICEDYRQFGSLKAPVRRRVLPLFSFKKPLPGPALVAIDIHEIMPVSRLFASGKPER
jgi:hypothetical protein